MVLIRSPDKGYCLVKIRYDWETTVRGGVGMLNQYDRHSPKENKNKRPRKWDGGGGGLGDFYNLESCFSLMESNVYLFHY